METHKHTFAEVAARVKSDMLELDKLSSTEESKHSIRELEKAHQAVMAAHSEMLQLLANQQMDVALQKFESDVAPRLQDIASASKRIVEMQSKDLESMSGQASEHKASTNWIMSSLIALSLVAGVLVMFILRNGTSALRKLTGEINVCANEVSQAS